MLIFRNKGVINETALTVNGVSAKDAEKSGGSPIGVFGTGVKNAIAIVLRLGGQVAVYKGKKRLEFGLRTETVRGQEFRIVTMNGRKLGFTDRLGLNWEPWMAYREFWSNNHDEGGNVYRIDEPFDANHGEAGYTRFVVECHELERVHEERHKIILQTEPMIVLPGLEVHPGTSHHIFYRGIRIMELPHKKMSMYSYNLTDKQTLTEDRTLLYPFMVPGQLMRGIVKSANMAYLYDVLGRRSVDMYEGSLNYSAVQDDMPSPQFMEVADQLMAKKELNAGAMSLFKHYQDTLPGYVSPYLVEPTGAEETVVLKAIERLALSGGLRLDRSRIRFKSKLTLGRVQVTKRDGMILDHALIKRGEIELAGAMVEGLAMMADGSGVVEKLARYIVSGGFLDKNRQPSPIMDALHEEYAVPAAPPDDWDL